MGHQINIGILSPWELKLFPIHKQVLLKINKPTMGTWEFGSGLVIHCVLKDHTLMRRVWLTSATDSHAVHRTIRTCSFL